MWKHPKVSKTAGDSLTPSFMQPSLLLVQLHEGPVQLPEQLQLPQTHTPRSGPEDSKQKKKKGIWIIEDKLMSKNSWNQQQPRENNKSIWV